MRAPMWSRIINHPTGTVSNVAAVYNRYGYLDEKRQALEAWAGEIQDMHRLAVTGR